MDALRAQRLDVNRDTPPDLLGGTDTVLAVNSYVTKVNCSGVGYSQRVDVPEVLDWILSFLE